MRASEPLALPPPRVRRDPRRRRHTMLRLVPSSLERACVEAALARCGSRERLLLSLLLVERLTPREAAGVMGVPLRRVERHFSKLMARLRRVLSHLVPSRARPGAIERPAAIATRGRRSA